MGLGRQLMNGFGWVNGFGFFLPPLGKTDGMEGDKSGTGSVLSLDNELPDRE